MTPEQITDAMNLIKRYMERNDLRIDELRENLKTLEEEQDGYRKSLRELNEAWFEATRK